LISTRLLKRIVPQARSSAKWNSALAITLTCRGGCLARRPFFNERCFRHASLLDLLSEAGVTAAPLEVISLPHPQRKGATAWSSGLDAAIVMEARLTDLDAIVRAAGGGPLPNAVGIIASACMEWPANGWLQSTIAMEVCRCLERLAQCDPRLVVLDLAPRRLARYLHRPFYLGQVEQGRERAHD
jgi:hypothetical protein